ncbi:MAG: hypothetical protein JST01_26710 [Cyanobacteria bacterium SZAS TMP-1]|nr:hypothetical protein [Cyanobacteria bacterium SZAS TMP-1]
MKPNQTPEHYSRVVSAVLERGRVAVLEKAASASHSDEAVTAAFDAVALIDTMIKRRNLHHYTEVLVTAARGLVAIVDCGDRCAHAIERDILLNLAINFQMVAVESLDKQGKHDDARSLLRAACAVAAKLSRWQHDSRPKVRVLDQLSWDNRPAPRLLCDVAVARERLSMMQEEVRTNLRAIETNLSGAQLLLDESDALLSTCKSKFELANTDATVWRLRPTTPRALTEAQAILAAGARWIETIDRKSGDDGTVRQSTRAVAVARLVGARAKAFIAEAYVEYWQGARGLDQFGVLGHQALAYAGYVHSNWAFDAPLMLLRPQEELCPASEDYLRRACQLADCAHAYALCLDGQMSVLPAKMQLPAFEPVKAAVAERAPYVVELPLIKEGPGTAHLSQLELGTMYRRETADDLREISAYTPSRQRTIFAKQRLVGFERSRGGKKK